MERDAWRVVPGPRQLLLGVVLIRHLAHDPNDDGAPDDAIPNAAALIRLSEPGETRVEEETGRKVAALMSGSHQHPDLICETFVLAPTDLLETDTEDQPGHVEG